MGAVHSRRNDQKLIPGWDKKKEGSEGILTCAECAASSAFVQQASCRFRSWAREGVKPDDSYGGEDCYELDAEEYGSHYL